MKSQFSIAGPALAAALMHVTTAHSSDYIYGPSQRKVTPKSLYMSNGTVLEASNLGQGTTFRGINSSITVDFGINIGGTVQFEVESVTGKNPYLGFTFTESSQWISPYVCDSGTSALRDSPLWFALNGHGSYAAPKERQRGGFRYMSIWHNSTGSVRLSSVSVNVTVDPTTDDLRLYTGSFDSDNTKLNRVWYAGAWTNQLCLIDPIYGNALGVPGTDWYYNSTIANGSTVLIDGAKRDRLVWPGDIFVSGPSIFVSTNRLDGIRNGIDSIMILQNAQGQLPWAGTPFTNPTNFLFSFTYHHYTLIDLYNYYTFTGDLEYVKSYWEQYKDALSWSLSQIDDSGFANVTSTFDWLRAGMGGHNGEANAILYYTLNAALQLAEAVADTSVRANYTKSMRGIKKAINTHLWDPSQNLYYDNDTIQVPESVHPQDGNSWAIIAGIASPKRAALISQSLMSRWVKPYGAPAPEAGPTISPFASGFELKAHYLAGFPKRAEELMEFMWADFMLDDPRMTNSSFIEGYSTDGSLHYAPYSNDARISYAHGWATSPTSALSFYGAGLQLTGPAGITWMVQPRLGKLKKASAAYETPLGSFSVDWAVAKSGAIVGTFSVPKGTSGTVVLPFGKGKTTLEGVAGTRKPSSSAGSTVTFNQVAGGKYIVKNQ